MIAPSNYDWRELECCIEVILARRRRFRLGPAAPKARAPRVLNSTRRAPKLRTFIRGNARMT